MESDHISRVANIRKTQIKKFDQVGIKTMHSLATTELTYVKDMEISTLETLKNQARLQLASAGLAKPLFEVLPLDEENPRRGLALLPPASPIDVYFDMEGYPHIEGGLEYLFGAAYIDYDSLQFNEWWAHDRAAEKLAFEQFVDWIYSRWKTDPNMHVYHYGNYEVTKMRLLMGRHGTRELELDQLLRVGTFVDLYSVVRQALRIGEPKYSIKNVEHLYMEKRTGEVATAIESVVQYQKWLADKDGLDWTTSKILAEIRAYNKDCLLYTSPSPRDRTRSRMPSSA